MTTPIFCIERAFLGLVVDGAIDILTDNYEDNPTPDRDNIRAVLSCMLDAVDGIYSDWDSRLQMRIVALQRFAGAWLRVRICSDWWYMVQDVSQEMYGLAAGEMRKDDHLFDKQQEE